MSNQGVIHVVDLLKETEVESKWLVNQLIPEEGVTVISGDPASFKTWTALHMAACIADGKPVFGKFTSLKKKVLVVEEEDPRNAIKTRMRMLSFDPASSLYFLINYGFKIDDEFGTMAVDNAIKSNGIEVLFIDSFVRIHDGNENDSKDTAAVFNKLRQYTKKGVTVILIHHHRKSPSGSFYDKQPLRGSSDILAAVDCHLSIKRKDKDTIKVDQPKVRIAREITPFNVEVKSDDTTFNLDFKEFDSPQSEDGKNKKEVAKELVLDELTKNSSITRIELVSAIKDQGVGENAIGDALRELEVEGKIIVATGKKGKKTFSIVPTL